MEWLRSVEQKRMKNNEMNWAGRWLKEDINAENKERKIKLNENFIVLRI